MTKRLTNTLLTPLLCAVLCTACGGSDGGDDNGLPAPIPAPTPAPSNTEANANKNDDSFIAHVGQLEFPKIKGGSDNVVVTHQTENYGITYAIEWDHSKKAQRWTCYTLYQKTQATNGNTRKKLWPDGDPWNYDPTIPMEEQQATYNELSKSYYPGTSNAYFEKGHICPSADRLYTKDANEQTYYMTNIMPMVKNFNGGIWESMEEQVRTFGYAADTLYICKGGTIDREDQILGYTTEAANVNGESTPHTGHHIIPRYFFMALLAKKGDSYKALGFWVEHLNEDHKGDPLGNYVVNIDDLEQKTGIDFFCNLPDDLENSVESASVDEIKKNWGVR